jgi:hypothetical protein
MGPVKPAKRIKRSSLRQAPSADDQRLAEEWAQALSSGPVEAVAQRINELGPKAAPAVRLLASSSGEAATFLLQALARPGTDREVRAAARAALHKLSGGVAQAETAAPVHPGARVATLYRVLGSSYDGNGSRALWLAGERPLGGIYFVTMTLHDVQGLIDCAGKDTSRKRFSQQEAEMRAKDPMAWAELPVEYGRQLVVEGIALAREAGRRVPTGYAVWAPIIGEPETPFEEALIYKEINAFEAKMHPAWLGETPRLFEQPEIEAWFFEPKRVDKIARQLAEPAAQRLVITPESDQARVERLREAISELLSDADLKGLRRRLEETALIFFQTDRLVDAQRAVAAAVTLEEARPLRSPHPFLRALLERSIDIAQRVQRTGFEPVRLTNLDTDAAAAGGPASTEKREA